MWWLAALLIVSYVQAVIRLDLLKLPQGFTVHVVQRDVYSARQMALNADNSFLFVGSDDAKRIYAISLSRNKQYGDEVVGTKIYTLAADLTYPFGVAYDDATDTLYFSQLRGVYQFKNVVKELTKPFPVLPLSYTAVNNRYPADAHHGPKYLRYRNGRIYVPQGAPCNVCKPNLPYASLTSINTTGGDLKYHARGIRNTVGYDWHPTRDELWFTDNGRDGLGAKPGDELNVIYPQTTNETKHYGFPYCYGKKLFDKDFTNETNCDAYEPAKYELDPHVAALGMTFYKQGTESHKLPIEYRSNDLVLIAEHGSWDSPTAVGYRISIVNTSDPSPSAYRTFVDGFLMAEKRSVKDSGYAWGRPVDVLMMNDASILISDDKASAIYRISFNATVEPFQVSSPFLNAFLPIVSVLILIGMAVSVFGTILWSQRNGLKSLELFK